MPLKTMDVLKNKWPMAKVTAAKSHQNGLVRSVYLKSSDRPEREKAKITVEQPVDKIVLLLEVMCSIPTKEPTDVSQ